MRNRCSGGFYTNSLHPLLPFLLIPCLPGGLVALQGSHFGVIASSSMQSTREEACHIGHPTTCANLDLRSHLFTCCRYSMLQSRIKFYDPCQTRVKFPTPISLKVELSAKLKYIVSYVSLDLVTDKMVVHIILNPPVL